MHFSVSVLALAASLLVPPVVAAQTYPSNKDPRTTLAPGRHDAGIAILNMRLVSATPKAAVHDTARGLAFINSDLAFGDKYVYQGNFAGFTIWDVSDPAKPRIVSAVSCITSQGDPSIYGNLLFLSAEGGGNRNDCAKGGVQDPRDHMAGVRIYDVSDPAKPRLVKNVQTCKGSHTHTIVPHPRDENVIYIYVSGSQGARPETELPGCKEGTDPADESNSLYRLDIIKVPLNQPENAEVVGGARIFTDLGAAPRASSRPARGSVRNRAPNDSTAPSPPPTGPRNCHDVTAYPAMGLLAGACGSYGLLVDISNPEKPVRLDARADTNFSLWHTAVFSNDGKKVVFTDEWGGGTSPMCQASSMMEMGGNTILTIDRERKYTQHAYFKIPAAQTAEENCVSHNGGLIPVPGRDIMVQGWYQGGVSVMEFTDPDNPRELAYFDRGSIDPPRDVDVPAPPQERRASRGTIGGSWGAYWWNGHIYSSELDRGFDILELEPSDQLSRNEIEAAKLVRFREYNPQTQPKIEWPAAFPVIRSYLDQLVRGNGLSAERTSAIASALDDAEEQTDRTRRDALNVLARQVDNDVAGAKDPERVKAMSAAIKALAMSTR
ncbi:MAG: LVIVD repeat-containing protein [Gemmatimonadaceae bacterium]